VEPLVGGYRWDSERNLRPPPGQDGHEELLDGSHFSRPVRCAYTCSVAVLACSCQSSARPHRSPFYIVYLNAFTESGSPVVRWEVVGDLAADYKLLGKRRFRLTEQIPPSPLSLPKGALL
jgi:hypothetical protein